MMKKISIFKIFIVFSLLFSVTKLDAQVSMGQSVPPNAFSVLELYSKSSAGDIIGGLRLPYITTDERDNLTTTYGENAGFEGLVIFNITIQCIEYWNGTKWISLCESSSNIYITGGEDCDQVQPTTPLPDTFIFGNTTIAKCFVPVEDPGCTANPPFTTTLIVGTGYATLTNVEPATGKFQVMFTSSNPTPVPRMAIVRVVSACTGSHKDFVFIQEGDPCAALAVPTLAAAPAAICPGTPVTFTAAPAGADEYEWFRNGASLGTTGNENTLEDMDVAAQYTVKYKLGECWSAMSAPFTLTNSIKPKLNLVGDWPQPPICLGKTIQEVKCIPNDVTYTWTCEDPSLIGITPFGIGDIAEIDALQGTLDEENPYTWYKVEVENACGTANIEFWVSISCVPCPDNVIGIIMDNYWCYGLELLISPKTIGPLSAEPGVLTYNWTVSNGWTIVGSNTGYNVQILKNEGTTESGLATCAKTYSCGEPVIKLWPLEFRHGDSGVGILTGPRKVCAGGGPYTYTLSQGFEHYSYASAHFPAGWIVTEILDEINRIKTYTVYVPVNAEPCNPFSVITFNGCASTIKCMHPDGIDPCGGHSNECNFIFVTDLLPTDPSAITGPACVDNNNPTTLTYSVTDISDATFNWTLPLGWTIVSGEETHSITVTPSGSTGYELLSVKTSTGCGYSTPSELYISGHNFSPPVIEASCDYLCGYVTITTDIESWITVDWYHNGVLYDGEFVIGAYGNAHDNPLVLGLPGSAGEWYAVQSIGDCISGQSNTITLTYLPFPGCASVTAVGFSVNGSQDVTTLCAGSAITMAVNGSPVCNVEWFVNNVSIGTGNPFNYTVPTGVSSVTIKSVRSYNPGCGSPFCPIVDSKVFTVSGSPASAPTIAPASICGTDPAVLTATASGSPAGYIWYKDGVSLDNTGNTYTTTTPGEYKVCVYYGTALGCLSAMSAPVNIAISAAPVISWEGASPDGNQNLGTKKTYGVTAIPADATFAWSSSDPGVVSVTSIPPDHKVAELNFLSTGTSTITVTATNNCGTDDLSATVSICDKFALLEANNAPIHLTCYSQVINFPAFAQMGCHGSVVYQWQHSTDETTWEPAPGTNTEASYTPPVILFTDPMHYYRLKAECTTGCEPVYCKPFVVIPRPLAKFAPLNLTFAGQTDYIPTDKDQEWYTISGLQRQREFMVFSANGTYTYNEIRDLIGATCGGYYQWGRADNPQNYTRHGDPSTNSPQMHKNNITYCGGPLNWVCPGYNQYFIFSTTDFDWMLTSKPDLWGNGYSINTPTPGGGWPNLPMSTTTYQQPVKTLDDPCPPGWRVPTQDDFEVFLDYCDPSSINLSGIDISSGVWHSPTGFTWVAYRADWGPAAFPNNTLDLPATNSGWTYDVTNNIYNLGGYMIFKTTDYEKARSYGWDPAITGTFTGEGSSACFCTNPPCLNETMPYDWWLEPYLWLPATGRRIGWDGSFSNKGMYGQYWTSSTHDSAPNYAYCLEFDANSIKFNLLPRSTGQAVRCVTETP